MMEIKMQLGLETPIRIIRWIEKMEEETYTLILLAGIMVPIVICSLWALGLALLWQMFVLGVKGGLVLFWVCATYYLYCKAQRKQRCDKCTLLDMMLTVLFQTGIRIPAVVWRLVDYYVDSKSVDENPRPRLSDKPRVRFATPEKTVYEVESFKNKCQDDADTFGIQTTPVRQLRSPKKEPSAPTTTKNTISLRFLHNKIKNANAILEAPKPSEKPSPEDIKDIIRIPELLETFLCSEAETRCVPPSQPHVEILNQAVSAPTSPSLSKTGAARVPQRKSKRRQSTSASQYTPSSTQLE